MEKYSLSLDFLEWSSFIVAAVGVVFWAKLQTDLKIFTVIKFLSFGTDFVADFLVPFKVNPNYVINAYAIVDFCLLLWVYHEVFNNKNLKTFFQGSGVLLTMFGLVNLFLIQKGNFNSYTLIADSLVIIALSLYYFYWLLSNSNLEKPNGQPFFWINSGIVIYRSSTILLFMTREYFVNVLNDDLILLWTYNNTMGIIANLISFYGLWIAGRKTIITSNHSTYG